jgi:aminopeptidase N
VRERLAAAAKTHLDGAAPGSDRQLIWTRAWFGAIDATEDLDFARGLLDGSSVVEGLTVDTDVRWEIVGTLAAHGADPDDALVAAELERDPTDIGQRRAAMARASRPTQAAKAEAWRRLTDERLPLATMRAITAGFSQWGQDHLLQPYVERYFSSLRAWWDGLQREEALALINGLYPSRLVSTETVAATDAALAGDSLPGPVVRILLEGKDGIERALRARAADRVVGG